MGGNSSAHFSLPVYLNLQRRANLFGHCFILIFGQINLVRVHLEHAAPLITAIVFGYNVHVKMAAGVAVGSVVYFVRRVNLVNGS